MPKKKGFVVLQVPEDDWETLHETLVLDTASAAFDPKLRKEIRKALDKVKQLSEFVGERVMRYQLLYSEGCVDLSLVGNVCDGWDALEVEIVRWMKESDYNEENDGLYFAKLDGAGRLIETGTFSGKLMDECREKAGIGA